MTVAQLVSLSAGALPYAMSCGIIHNIALGPFAPLSLKMFDSPDVPQDLGPADDQFTQASSLAVDLKGSLQVLVDGAGVAALKP